MNKILGITDNTLFIFIVILSLFGLVLLYSATNQNIDLLYRQSIRLFFCFALMLAISCIDFNKLKSLSPYIYILCLLFLVFTLFWGHSIKGAQRWIIIMGFSFQVSEVLKIIVPMMLAWYLSLSDEKEIAEQQSLIPQTWKQTNKDF